MGEILERKEKSDGDLEMYDKDVDNAMKQFIMAKEDNKYNYG